MRLGVPSLLVVCALSACGTTRSRGARAPSARDAAAASIARVEHGLIPDVRFAGEEGGWSIDERLRALHVPGVSLAVIHGGRVAWAKAYGVADVPSGRRLDVDARFGAASISKLVTALAALQLVDGGQVALDADINQALRGWRVPDNALTRGHAVTLRQLLAHTGGINLHTVLGYEPDAPLPTLPQILDGVAPANTMPVRVEYVPGQAFHYSGGGLLIVQQLLVELVGQPFAQLMQERLFAPLGLTHTTFALRRSPDEPRATAHDVDASVWPERLYPDAAPAGLWTTPSDLARLLVEVQRGRDGRSSLVSRAMAQAMTTPLAPIGVPDVWTAAGTFVERHGHTLYFGHDGHNEGYLSMARATLDGEGAVVMTNGEGGAELIFEIMRSIAAEYKWEGWLAPPLQPTVVDAARLQSFVGRYRVGLDRVVQVVVDGGALTLREPFAEPRRLVAIVDGSNGGDGDGADGSGRGSGGSGGSGDGGGGSGGVTFVSRDDGTRLRFQAGQLIEKSGDDAAVTLTRVGDDVVTPLELLAAGHDAAALAQYRALLAAHPSDEALAEERFDARASELLYQRRDVARALQLFQVEAALHPSSASAHAGLALAYLRAGRRADAASEQTRAEALWHDGSQLPELAEAYLWMRMNRLQRLTAAAAHAR